MRDQVGWGHIKVLRQRQRHGLRAAVRQGEVIARIANRIRVTFDEDHGARVLLDQVTQCGADIGQCAGLFRLDRGGAGGEAHGIEFQFRRERAYLTDFAHLTQENVRP